MKDLMNLGLQLQQSASKMTIVDVSIQLHHRPQPAQPLSLVLSDHGGRLLTRIEFPVAMSQAERRIEIANESLIVSMYCEAFPTPCFKVLSVGSLDSGSVIKECSFGPEGTNNSSSNHLTVSFTFDPMFSDLDVFLDNSFEKLLEGVEYASTSWMCKARLLYRAIKSSLFANNNSLAYVCAKAGVQLLDSTVMQLLRTDRLVLSVDELDQALSWTNDILEVACDRVDIIGATTYRLLVDSLVALKKALLFYSRQFFTWRVAVCELAAGVLERLQELWLLEAKNHPALAGIVERLLHASNVVWSVTNQQRAAYVKGSKEFAVQTSSHVVEHLEKLRVITKDTALDTTATILHSAQPLVQQAIQTASPVVKSARQFSEPLVGPCIEKVRPVVDPVLQRLVDVLAHSELLKPFIDKIATQSDKLREAARAYCFNELSEMDVAADGGSPGGGGGVSGSGQKTIQPRDVYSEDLIEELRERLRAQGVAV